MTKQTITAAAGLIAGACYVLVSSHVPWMHQPISRLVLLTFPILVPVVLVLAALSRRAVRWTVASLLIGIIGGVLVDVVADPKPRNLFPLEIAAWFVVVAPALVLGATGGYWLRRKRKTAEQG